MVEELELEPRPAPENSGPRNGLLRVEIHCADVTQRGTEPATPWGPSEEILGKELEDSVALMIWFLADELQTATEGDNKEDRTNARRVLQRVANALGVAWPESAEERARALFDAPKSGDMTKKLARVLQRGRRIYKAKLRESGAAVAAAEARRAIEPVVRIVMEWSRNAGCKPDFDCIQYEHQWRRLFRPSEPGKAPWKQDAARLLGLSRNRS